MLIINVMVSQEIYRISVHCALHWRYAIKICVFPQSQSPLSVGSRTTFYSGSLQLQMMAHRIRLSIFCVTNGKTMKIQDEGRATASPHPLLLRNWFVRDVRGCRSSETLIHFCVYSIPIIGKCGACSTLWHLAVTADASDDSIFAFTFQSKCENPKPLQMWQMITVIPNWSVEFVTRIYFLEIIFHHLITGLVSYSTGENRIFHNKRPSSPRFFCRINHGKTTQRSLFAGDRGNCSRVVVTCSYSMSNINWLPVFPVNASDL